MSAVSATYWRSEVSATAWQTFMTAAARLGQLTTAELQRRSELMAFAEANCDKPARRLAWLYGDELRRRKKLEDEEPEVHALRRERDSLRQLVQMAANVCANVRAALDEGDVARARRDAREAEVVFDQACEHW